MVDQLMLEPVSSGRGEARQCDVHRRDVEDHHRLSDQQDEEQRPAPLAARRLDGWCGGRCASVHAWSSF